MTCIAKLSIPILLFFSSCEWGAEPRPGCIVYSTRGDYLDLVPIGLRDNKTKVSYVADPTDLYYITGNGDTIIFGKPTRLVNNYLLDNRGIWTNVAFLNITYEEYIKY